MSSTLTPPEASGDAPTPAPLAPTTGQAAEPRQRHWNWRPKLRWFAAEYFIVVLGVLTAVAINAWWVGMQERDLEMQSLRELHAALTNDLVDIRSNIASHRRADASARLLRAHLRAGGAYADTLDAHFGRVLGATFTIRDEAAYETLKQRGMATITDDSIRTTIGRVYGMEYPRVVGFQGSATDMTLRDVVPFYNANFGDLRLFQTATPVDYPALQASVEYAAILDWLVMMHAGQAGQMEALEAEVVTLIALLDDELRTR